MTNPVADKAIDKLIARRNKLTNRRDSLTDWSLIDKIDENLAQLSPAGERNDVDLLLGRTCATLPQRPHIVMVAVDTDAKQETVYDAASHYDTIAQRHAVLAPGVDLFDMRDMTGTNVMPMTVETRCLVNLINDDQGMMGDRG